MMLPSRKYCRTLHAPISLGTSSDDRFMPRGYLRAFAEAPEGLIISEKLDGQNNCLNQYGVFARSHTSPSQHPWDRPLWQRWQLIKKDLKNLEIFGENMFGIHSIAYRKLESYFYVFAVREGDYWLSWEEVKFYAALLDFPTVPEIPISRPLRAFFDGQNTEEQILAQWLEENLEMPWQKSVETGGKLAGYDPKTKEPCSEGFVVRHRAGFSSQNKLIDTAENEFGNLFKLVRASHVKTEVHWSKTWQAAPLCDYEKYKWFGYEYLGSG